MLVNARQSAKAWLAPLFSLRSHKWVIIPLVREQGSCFCSCLFLSGFAMTVSVGRKLFGSKVSLINHHPFFFCVALFLPSLLLLCLSFGCFSSGTSLSGGFKCLAWSLEKPRRKIFEAVGEKREVILLGEG